MIGLGHVGCPLAAVMAGRGHDVTGIDRSSRIVDEVNSGKSSIAEPGLDRALSEAVENGRLVAQTSMDGLGRVDAVVIAVGTPIRDDDGADLRALENVCREIAPVIVNDQLVVLKSTVPPGTTDDLVAPILTARARVDIAFCPERLAEGQAIRDLGRLPVVVGGMTSKATARALEFFEAALGTDCIPVSGPRSAELVKLADNLWIDLNIALANELAKLADTLGIDVFEIISAANSLPKGQNNVNILAPSMGVGGSCLTKDPWFLAGFARDNGIDMEIPSVSRGINNGMPGYAVSRISAALAAARPGIRAEDIKIAILGVTYKSDTSDCRFSPAKPAIDALSASGYRLAIHDPLVSATDARLVTDQPLVDVLEDALDGADCVAFFTAHEEFAEIGIEYLANHAASGAVVFDGRALFATDDADTLRALGLSYIGVGRS